MPKSVRAKSGADLKTGAVKGRVSDKIISAQPSALASSADLDGQVGGTVEVSLVVPDQNPPDMQRASQADRPANCSHTAGAHRFEVAATHFNPGDPGAFFIRCQHMGCVTAERFRKTDRSPTMQYAKRLHRAVVNRHFTTKKIRAHGCNQHAEVAFQAGSALLIDFYEAGTALAYICFQ